MTAPNGELERRLRDHYRSRSTPLPDEVVDGARARIRARRTDRKSLLLAASLGALVLTVVAVAVGAPPTEKDAPLVPSVPPTMVAPSPRPSASNLATHEAGQVLRVSGEGLRDRMEAYVGDYLYVVEVVAADDGSAAYLLQGPPRNGAEDASAVTLPVDVVDRNTEPTLVDCPDAPTTLSELEVIEPFRRVVCFEMLPLTLRDVWVERPVGGHAGLGGTPDGRLSRFAEPGSGSVPFSVAEGVALRGPGWVTAVGRFGLHDATCGDSMGTLLCRERFVVGAVGPGDSPFAALDGTWDRMADAPIRGRAGYVALPIEGGIFIWGGDIGEEATTGAISDVVANRWTRIARAPSPDRYGVASAWSGSEVLIWGGNDSLADGLAYDPAADQWSTIPAAPIRGGNGYGAWTGTEFIVVSSSAEAAAWNPPSATWRRLPDPPVPPGHMEWAWTGRELLVLGIGDGDFEKVVGAAFDPSTSTWRSIAEVPYGGLVLGVPAVWANAELLFVSHAYDPGTDRWRIVKREGCEHGAVTYGVWTGRWVLSQTQAYDPAVGRCWTLPDAPIRPGFENEGFEMRTHEFHTPVWIEDRLIVWSGGTGLDGPGSPPDGVVFAPAEP